jgi:hypothetical protein
MPENSMQNLKDFKCKNRECRRTVGQTNGENLFINGKPFPFEPHYIGFDCPFCHQKVHWTRTNGKK